MYCCMSSGLPGEPRDQNWDEGSFTEARDMIRDSVKYVIWDLEENGYQIVPIRTDQERWRHGNNG